jgi:hypothetical protein
VVLIGYLTESPYTRASYKDWRCTIAQKFDEARRASSSDLPCGRSYILSSRPVGPGELTLAFVFRGLMNLTRWHRFTHFSIDRKEPLF